ncbi:hypothetical protein LTR78_001594 [Recurvomyces mirabilis]|uniref:Extracellular mutant protein 11 C-terminal domain-containing protein n=1 Tax=Recurvomyces mirabilis TaxID=574656 RepID=A0AAE0WUY6_9PEZI|nr:hypothetical protein LTR78_001594 [Recurvomyces mirabilis]KAK5151834.1 hypothetical protein LTS14_008968 [Recurvomyces mirabilis]
MASKQTLTDFVRRDEHAASTERSLDRYKVPTKLPHNRQNKQSTSNAQAAHRNNGVADVTRHPAVAKDTEPKHFYDTDDSSIDRESTIASVQLPHEAQQREASHQQQKLKPKYAPGSPLHSDEEYVTEPEDLADDPLSRAAPQKRKSSHHHNDETATPRPDGGAGVSYAEMEQHTASTTELRSQMPTHISGRRHQPQEYGQGQAQTRQRNTESRNENVVPYSHPLSRNPADATQNTLQQMACGYRTAPRGPKNAQAEPKAIWNQPRQTSHGEEEGQGAGQVATQLPKQREPQRRSLPKQKPQPPVVRASYARDAPQTDFSLLKPQSQANGFSAVPGWQQRVETGNFHNHYSPQGEGEQDSSPPAAGDDADADLDIDLPELYGLSYADLKSAEFDQNPRISQLPGQGETLSKDLESMLTKGSKDQIEYFSTLNIVVWEEAGDWFLGRYSEVVKKLKAARQEKRKAARLFEDEIEARHEAVSMKRQQTEAALGDMKASGAQVLQGTPKKAKKAM